MTGAYDPLQVALSVLIAVSASYAALDLAGRVTAASGRVRLAWLIGGSTAMGIGIWAMHYIGMLAFHLPVPVQYDWPTVLVSLLAGVLCSAFALLVVSRKKMGATYLFAGSAVLGCGIAAVHYIGMAAMRLPAECRFNFGLVALSIVLAILFSLAALWLAFYFRDEAEGMVWRKIGSAVVMGTAISAMHYTGMAAARFAPSESNPDLANAVSVSTLGTAGIGVVVLILLGVSVLTCALGRRFSSQSLELALAEAKAELGHLTRVATLGELAASIAHEINQPLGAVVSYGSAALRWLSAQPPNLDQTRQAVSGAIQEANRASEVIAKIRALLAKTPPEKTLVEINKVIGQALSLLRSELRKSDVRLRTELAPDLPPVPSDSAQLQQVVLNLVINAVEAMSAITDRPRELIIRSTKDPHGVRVEVEDSGKGMDRQQAERIFEPFFTTKPAGIGMGLAISRSIVEAHGGRLWVTSKASHGAIFQFTLSVVAND